MDSPQPDSYGEIRLYRWGYHKETGYQWWISRLAYVFRLYDVVRIDHFRGFDEYFLYSIRGRDGGRRTLGKRPGMDLFWKVRETLGEKTGHRRRPWICYGQCT